MVVNLTEAEIVGYILQREGKSKRIDIGGKKYIRITTAELARATPGRCSTRTMQRRIRALEQAGLIARCCARAERGGRFSLVRVTEAGRKIAYKGPSK